MELQDGDILGIDDYQLLVNDIHAASSAIVVAKPATVLSSSTAAIPSEIWDSLAKEFSIQTIYRNVTNLRPRHPKFIR